MKRGSNGVDDVERAVATGGFVSAEGVVERIARSQITKPRLNDLPISNTPMVNADYGYLSAFFCFFDCLVDFTRTYRVGVKSTKRQVRVKKTRHFGWFTK